MVAEITHSANRSSPDLTVCGIAVETPGLKFHDRVHATCPGCHNPPIQLTEWECLYASSDPYCPPESAGLRLGGVVTGHPRKEDGKRVVTSGVVRVEGRRFWTKSGSEYELVGPPSAEYLAYLRETGRTYNEAEPIRVVGKAASNG